MSPHRKALLAARALIEEGVERFICFALDTVADHLPSLAAAAGDIKARIQEELELRPCATLGTWLLRRDIELNDNQLYLARLAWIDKLLESYP